MADNDAYTKDGTIDLQGNPAEKTKTGSWKACRYILGTEFMERLAYHVMSSILFLYVTSQLRQDDATASRNLLIWAGICNITPLIGAFLADSFLMRFWTIAIFSMINVLGLILLTLTASLYGPRYACVAKDECHSSVGQTLLSFIALYTIALGMGGIEPCLLCIGADQFDDTDEKERKQKASFFNWFYLLMNVDALIPVTVLVYVAENVSWRLGFAIPTLVMAIAVASFFSGSRLYRNQKPGGNPITRIAQVVTVAVKKRHVEVPEDKALLYETAEDTESAIKGSRKLEHTNDFRFFDKAAVEEAPTDQVINTRCPWHLCTVTQVEELKAIIRLLPVWATAITFSAICTQMSSLSILQGSAMDRQQYHSSTFLIPAAFETVSIVMCVPVYDRLVVPIARRVSGHPNGLTQLQRMRTGLTITILAMASAGVVEVARLDMVERTGYYGRGWVPMSVLWQVPQYFLIGCAKVFMVVGQMEFFYEQAPDAMRSLCSALSLTTVALGNYLSSLLVTIVVAASTKGGKQRWIQENLDYFFWLLAILSVLNLRAFVVISKWYTYKKPIGTLR